jgi:hypothetical protein
LVWEAARTLCAPRAQHRSGRQSNVSHSVQREVLNMCICTYPLMNADHVRIKTQVVVLQGLQHLAEMLHRILDSPSSDLDWS